MLRLEAQGRGNRRVVCGTRHGQRPSPDRQCRYPALLRGVSAPGVEAVEVQDGVQHHRTASPGFAAIDRVNGEQHDVALDRKSTRLNSSHGYISYAVFCLKKKKKRNETDIL